MCHRTTELSAVSELPSNSKYWDCHFVTQHELSCSSHTSVREAEVGFILKFSRRYSFCEYEWWRWIALTSKYKIWLDNSKSENQGLRWKSKPHDWYQKNPRNKYKNLSENNKAFQLKFPKHKPRPEVIKVICSRSDIFQTISILNFISRIEWKMSQVF